MGAGQVGVDENSASGAFLQNAFLLKNRQKSGNPLLRLLKMGVWAGICLPQKDSPAGRHLSLESLHHRPHHCRDPVRDTRRPQSPSS